MSETDKTSIKQILKERFIECLTQTEIGALFNMSQREIGEILKTLGVSETDKINVSQILTER